MSAEDARWRKNGKADFGVAVRPRNDGHDPGDDSPPHRSKSAPALNPAPVTTASRRLLSLLFATPSLYKGVQKNRTKQSCSFLGYGTGQCGARLRTRERPGWQSGSAGAKKATLLQPSSLPIGTGRRILAPGRIAVYAQKCQGTICLSLCWCRVPCHHTLCRGRKSMHRFPVAGEPADDLIGMLVACHMSSRVAQLRHGPMSRRSRCSVFTEYIYPDQSLCFRI